MGKIVIIDASCFTYRCFFANPIDPAGAIRAMIGSALDYHKPDRAMLALDAGRETFRNEIYPPYKSNRAPAPEGYSHAALAMAAALIQMGIKPYSSPGYEADDVAGTLCARHENDDRIIISRDKDFAQLVVDTTAPGRNGVRLWCDGKWTGEIEVVEKFGVPPKRVVEVMGLMGDSTDGIPGVNGIGVKIAIELIQYFQDLENLFDNLQEVEQILERGAARVRKQLEHSREIAFLSRQLATIRTDVPLPGDTND